MSIIEEGSEWFKNHGIQGWLPRSMSHADKNYLGMIFISLYVDDWLCIGDKDTIVSLEKEFVNTGFQVKPSEELKNCLSWNININKEEGSAIFHQGHLIKKLNNLYGEQVKGLTTLKMSGTPIFVLVRITYKNGAVSKEEHEQYRNGVGMLLYLVKHARPDIANAVRELTR